MERDPVRGMSVDPQSAAGSAEHDRKTYYFCGSGCLEQFKKEPGKFAGG